jgi:hypothetical protein
MRALPSWYTDAVNDHAKLIVAGEETFEAALVGLRVLIRDDHREFGNSILDGYNTTNLTAGVRDATPAPVRVTPEVLLRVADAQDRGGVGEEVFSADPDTAAVVEKMVEEKVAVRVNGVVKLTPAGITEAERLRQINLQLALFPDVRPRLKWTPSRTEYVVAMDPHQLDMAKAMWTNKHKAWVAEIGSLNALYAKVRPLMGDGDTVGDVLQRLASRKPKMRRPQA